MEFPGKNTEAGCHFLLQGIFLTQRSNSHLLCFLNWPVGSLPLGLLEIPILSVLEQKIPPPSLTMRNCPLTPPFSVQLTTGGLKS